MPMRNDRDIERRDDRAGWQQVRGDIGRIQSREDMRGYQPRDWRHEDRFGTEQQLDERRRFDSDDDDSNRGWFDRVRDTASRWFRGRDDEDRDEDRDDDQRGERAQFQPRDEYGRFVDQDDDRGMRSRSRDDDDRRGDNARYQPRDERGRFIDDDDRRWSSRARDDEQRYSQQGRGRYQQHDRYAQGRYQPERSPGQGRYEQDRRSERERWMRSWQDDDNRGRMRRDDDNRVRQFAGYGRDDDDRSGQFNRLRDERGTLGMRGDQGLTGRTRYDRYDDRGRFSSFADDEQRRYYGEANRNERFGDERNRYRGDGRNAQMSGQLDRDEYGRFMPGRDRDERGDRDDDMRRSDSRMHGRSRRDDDRRF